MEMQDPCLLPSFLLLSFCDQALSRPASPGPSLVESITGVGGSPWPLSRASLTGQDAREGPHFVGVSPDPSRVIYKS